MSVTHVCVKRWHERSVCNERLELWLATVMRTNAASSSILS